MNLVFQVTTTGLAPADETAQEAFDRLKRGSLVRLEIKRRRNVEFHRKFYSLMRLIYMNQESYSDLEELVSVIKLAVGHVRLVELPDGTTWRVPKSIAFESMSASEFDDFYNRVLRLCRLHFGDALDHELAEYERSNRG